LPVTPPWPPPSPPDVRIRIGHGSIRRTHSAVAPPSGNHLPSPSPSLSYGSGAQPVSAAPGESFQRMPASPRRWRIRGRGRCTTRHWNWPAANDSPRSSARTSAQRSLDRLVVQENGRVLKAATAKTHSLDWEVSPRAGVWIHGLNATVLSEPPEPRSPSVAGGGSSGSSDSQATAIATPRRFEAAPVTATARSSPSRPVVSTVAMWLYSRADDHDLGRGSARRRMR